MVAVSFRFALSAIAAAALAALIGFAIGAGGAQAKRGDRNCSDFKTQAQAQKFFLSHGGPKRDPHRLDSDGDGIACENLPCPCAGAGKPKPHKPKPSRSRAPKPRSAQVIRVVDGDTIKVRLKGRSYDVRLIGIDTPEVYGGVECGGREASAGLKRLLPAGTRVKLIRDRSQDARDRYGRLLRYVEKGSIDVGRKQLLRGRATVYVYGGKPFKRVASYRKAQRKARAAGRGIWRHCR